tara:strand:- start:955 stop:1128 length:174 start_codon:yes stop_codon:yes gene_type:complete
MKGSEMPPYEKRELTDEEIRDWLRKASLRELNIFVDVNHIVFLLCHQLLKERKGDKG